RRGAADDRPALASGPHLACESPSSYGALDQRGPDPVGTSAAYPDGSASSRDASKDATRPPPPPPHVTDASGGECGHVPCVNHDSDCNSNTPTGTCAVTAQRSTAQSCAARTRSTAHRAGVRSRSAEPAAADAVRSLTSRGGSDRSSDARH